MFFSPLFGIFMPYFMIPQCQKQNINKRSKNRSSTNSKFAKTGQSSRADATCFELVDRPYLEFESRDVTVLDMRVLQPTAMETLMGIFIFS